jgi:hypothetical protein
LANSFADFLARYLAILGELFGMFRTCAAFGSCKLLLFSENMYRTDILFHQVRFNSLSASFVYRIARWRIFEHIKSRLYTASKRTKILRNQKSNRRQNPMNKLDLERIMEEIFSNVVF